ncbi:hypothetical protein [Crocosphaera sp. Alani8]|uniref:hypothetical protein n=1 Tax=Crocosphaera sp. Alani8 TaxID=3038952 RepID=UPI00313BC9BA
MNNKLTFKRKLATVVAISVLVFFGVETVAVANSNPFYDSSTHYSKDCRGDDKDEC